MLVVSVIATLRLGGQGNSFFVTFKCEVMDAGNMTDVQLWLLD